MDFLSSFLDQSVTFVKVGFTILVEENFRKYIMSLTFHTQNTAVLVVLNVKGAFSRSGKKCLESYIFSSPLDNEQRHTAAHVMLFKFCNMSVIYPTGAALK